LNPQPADYKSAALPIEPHWRAVLRREALSGAEEDRERGSYVKGET
jgi:hypothetical protein